MNLPPRVKKHIYKFSGKGCFYCRKPMPLSHLTIDHIVPRSRNGSNSVRNYVTACKKCNQSKSDKIFPHRLRGEERPRVRTLAEVYDGV